MHDHRVPALLLFAAGTLLLGSGCGSEPPTSPEGESRPTEALTFLRPAPDAPPIANPLVQFYAKRGETREVFIYHRPRAGESDSSEFVQFRVPAEALLRRPDGTLFQQGDSVLITMRVIDPARLIIDFQPSGLRFATAKPAELEISFEEANDDLDGDGDVDRDDDEAKRRLSIWRQEAPGQPWFRMASIVEFDLDEVEADLFGFSGYAIAF